VYYYIARERSVVVLAVLHGSQHPDTWKRRR
jgi:plasmid stabilization system protein ParE